MKMLDSIIEKRELPKLMKFGCGKDIKNAEDFTERREEIKKILSSSEYGITPLRPEHLRVKLLGSDESFATGRAPLYFFEFTVTLGGREFSFPVKAAIPKSKVKCPAIVHISYFDDTPNKYEPTEELCDKGFAVFSFNYESITKNNGDFKNGIAPFISKSRRRVSTPGKIAMWAFAASRIMDHIETLDEIDAENVAVAGHSLLGKAALVAGAFDERFKFVISNNSGTLGAALSRSKRGERLEDMANGFPFWFCPKFTNDATKFYDTAKYDQHFLLALMAPRYLLVGSAEGDVSADPDSEFLSCYKASEAYAAYGLEGLITGDEIPHAKTVLQDGNISYHIREGMPYFSREDWHIYTDFIKKNLR